MYLRSSLVWCRLLRCWFSRRCLNLCLSLLPEQSGSCFAMDEKKLQRSNRCFHEDDPDHYRKLEDFHVQHAVHSLAIDPATHRVYTPEQEENGKAVSRMIVYEAINRGSLLDGRGNESRFQLSTASKVMSVRAAKSVGDSRSITRRLAGLQLRIN